MAIKYRVIATHCIRLLQATVASHRGGQAFVPEQQAHRLVLPGVRREEQHGGEVAEQMGIQLTAAPAVADPVIAAGTPTDESTVDIAAMLLEKVRMLEGGDEA